jgi:hypothetical protein
MKLGISLYGLVGFFSLIKSELLPDRFQSYTLIRLIPHWPLSGWFSGLLVLLLAISLEGGHSAISRRDLEVSGLESDKAQQLLKEKEHSTPNFVLSAQTASSLCEGNDTLVLMGLRIENTGADSSVFRYHVHYHSETLDEDARITILSNDIRQVLPNGSVYEFCAADAINLQIAAIKRGEFRSGRLQFIVTGNKTTEIADLPVEMTVTIEDYRGRESSAVFIGGKKKDRPSDVVGEKISAGNKGSNV